MTNEQCMELLSAAYARVWAIRARASGNIGSDHGLAEVAAAACADIAAVKAYLALLPLQPFNLWDHVQMPPESDDDIPADVREELTRCASHNGRISYFYLCHVWRRGRRVGRESVIGICPECGPADSCDEDGCCRGCGHDIQGIDAVSPAGACCERLVVRGGALVFCDLVVGHIGSHEGPHGADRWWFDESGHGTLRALHPTTGNPLPPNPQRFVEPQNPPAVVDLMDALRRALPK